LQEYLDINKPVLEHIVTLGSDTALASDAARAWIEIRQHYVSLNADSLQRMSKQSSATDVAKLRNLALERVAKSLKGGGQLLALFLDPRPSMRKFVRDSSLLGIPADLTLGNTEELKLAKEALRTMAPGLTVGRTAGVTDTQIVEAVYGALLTFHEVPFLSFHKSWLICTQHFCIDTYVVLRAFARLPGLPLPIITIHLS
jgi:hypothetical protein